jgi:hypothetical protein
MVAVTIEDKTQVIIEILDMAAFILGAPEIVGVERLRRFNTIVPSMVDRVSRGRLQARQWGKAQLHFLIAATLCCLLGAYVLIEILHADHYNNLVVLILRVAISSLLTVTVIPLFFLLVQLWTIIPEKYGKGLLATGALLFFMARILAIGHAAWPETT